MKIKNALIIFFTLLLFILLFLSKDANRYEELKVTNFYFDTYITIHCFYSSSQDMEKIINKCWHRLDEIQTSMNSYSPNSQVSIINKNGFNGVEIKSDLYALINDSIKFSSISKGSFDITVKPLLDLWQKAKKNNEIPDIEIINKIKERIGYKFIDLNRKNYIYLKKQNMKIDLGAIAKGYAIDELTKILRKNGIYNFLIDAGGDMYCSGKKNGDKLWSIGIQDPKDQNNIIDKLNLSNMAVTTSGDYYRYNIIDNKKYSHIVNPMTGYPQQDVISATVIARTAKAADAYSTAICVLGVTKGLELINSLNDVEAMIAEEKDEGIKKYMSKGYSLYK